MSIKGNRLLTSISEFNDYIFEFENKYPVENWTYRNLDLWPIVKILSSVYVRNNEIKLSSDWEHTNGLASKGIKAKLVSFYYKGVLILKNVLNLISFFFSRKKKVPIMLFGSYFFREKTQGGYINPFFQPIINYCFKKRRIRIPVLDYNTGGESKMDFYKRVDEWHIQRKHFEVFKLQTFFRKKFKGDDIFDLFISGIEAINFDKHELKVSLLSQINSIYSKTFIYKAIFSKIYPQYAVCLTFFNEEMFAMIATAKKMGIKTIDMAHGYNNDPNCIIYYRHKEDLRNDLNVFPDIFWVWDHSVSLYHHSHLNDEKVTKKIIIGGNTRVEYFKSRIKNIPKVANKKVLLTLTANFPEQFIIDAIQKTQENYTWYIRIHPSRKTHIGNLENLLRANGIFQGINLKEAQNLPLFDLIVACDYHISYYSSCIIESVLFDKQPIVFDDLSKKHYRNLIESGKVIEIENKTSSSLLDCMNNLEVQTGEIKTHNLFKEEIDKLLNNHY